jgi:predicted SAM-dependent methyltransferase
MLPKVRRVLVRVEILLLRGVRRVSPETARSSLRRAIAELRLSLLHESECEKAPGLARRTSLKLNLGSGPRLRTGWINIDVDPRADLHLDVRRGLPFPDGSCAELYAEHLLEHFAFPGEVETILRDWSRVLAPGGVLSLGVPDTEWPLDAYANRADDYFARCRAEPWCPPWVETRLDQINYHFRQQSPDLGTEHLCAYDWETLRARLAAAGFAAIERRPFDPASDSEERRIGTLYVKARKP